MACGLPMWLAPRLRLLWPPVCWAVLAFSFSARSLLLADVEYLGRLEMMHVFVYAFLFLAILNNLHRQETIQIITVTLLFLAMAISFYAIYQFLTDSDQFDLHQAFPIVAPEHTSILITWQAFWKCSCR